MEKELESIQLHTKKGPISAVWSQGSGIATLKPGQRQPGMVLLVSVPRTAFLRKNTPSTAQNHVLEGVCTDQRELPQERGGAVPKYIEAITVDASGKRFCVYFDRQWPGPMAQMAACTHTHTCAHTHAHIHRHTYTHAHTIS